MRVLDECIRSCGARILHSHFGDHGWGDIGSANRNDLAHVVTFYGYDASRLPKAEPQWRGRYRELFDAADLFLCEGPHLGRVLQDLGCPAKKVRVHHLSIGLKQLAFRPRRWALGEPLRVLIAGTFVEKKGIPYAIAALGRIRDRAELEITIIGDAIPQERSDQEKAKIVDAIAEAGLASRTRLPGFQPHSRLLEEAYRNHVFIAPSVTASDGDTEGGAPVSVIEMAATGMPVVSTRHCDIPEVIVDGVTGLLADERDVDGLERHISWLLDHPDEWDPIVSAARRHIEKEFCASIQGHRLAEYYGALVRAG
jgi:colanic acid/amylovoran biosynthesis glycosyltransferase